MTTQHINIDKIDEQASANYIERIGGIEFIVDQTEGYLHHKYMQNVFRMADTNKVSGVNLPVFWGM